ncbi:hypothetical protein AWENTII_007675 [Aspergillus wentii]
MRCTSPHPHLQDLHVQLQRAFFISCQSLAELPRQEAPSHSALGAAADSAVAMGNSDTLTRTPSLNAYVEQKDSPSLNSFAPSPSFLSSQFPFSFFSRPSSR